jgi:hypothetical protein
MGAKKRKMRKAKGKRRAKWGRGGEENYAEKNKLNEQV